MDIRIQTNGCGEKPDIETFTLNGQDAFVEDFGHVFEEDDPDGIWDYACAPCSFVGNVWTQETLSKYNISVQEYMDIASYLTMELDFGGCGMCQ